MKIPKIISVENRECIFVKEYDNYILYKNMITGCKECFNKQDLNLVKELVKPTQEGRLRGITGLRV